jgi:hypothetical protein
LINVVFPLFLNILLRISEDLNAFLFQFLHLLQRWPCIDIALVVSHVGIIRLALFMQEIIFVCYLRSLFSLSNYLFVSWATEDVLLFNAETQLIPHFDVKIQTTLVIAFFTENTELLVIYSSSSLSSLISSSGTSFFANLCCYFLIFLILSSLSTNSRSSLISSGL